MHLKNKETDLKDKLWNYNLQFYDIRCDCHVNGSHYQKKTNESDKNIPSKNSGLCDFFLNLNNILSHPNSTRHARRSGEE